jgi:hypothetical protein
VKCARMELKFSGPTVIQTVYSLYLSYPSEHVCLFLLKTVPQNNFRLKNNINGVMLLWAEYGQTIL